MVSLSTIISRNMIVLRFHQVFSMTVKPTNHGNNKSNSGNYK
nr:MAG TPA: hypothetical protein [Microviridae sp.]